MPRKQLNIRMENKPEVYDALKQKAEELNTTMTDLTIAAIEFSLGWQIPVDAIAMLNKINANEAKIRKLEKLEDRIKALEEKNI